MKLRDVVFMHSFFSRFDLSSHPLTRWCFGAFEVDITSKIQLGYRDHIYISSIDTYKVVMCVLMTVSLSQKSQKQDLKIPRCWE